MKERPILFSDAMVRAILEGRKTQTRRVVDHLLGFGRITEFQKSDSPGYDWTFRNKRMLWNDITHDRFFECCPSGQVGDRLWVRECFAKAEDWEDTESGLVQHADYTAYRATEPHASVEKWTPSIHMPRRASRITLEITGVRVERLNAISEDDAVAEGIECIAGPTSCSPWRNYRIRKPGEMFMHCSAPSRSFMTLWESIYGPGSWVANQWVLVREFKRVTP